MLILLQFEGFGAMSLSLLYCARISTPDKNPNCSRVSYTENKTGYGNIQHNTAHNKKCCPFNPAKTKLYCKKNANAFKHCNNNNNNNDDDLFLSHMFHSNMLTRALQYYSEF